MGKYVKPPMSGEPRRKHRTLAELEEALINNFGNITYAAATLGMSSWGLRKRVNEEPRLQAARDEGEKRRLDVAEHLIDDSYFRKHDVKSAMWLLDRKAKHRGYGPTGSKERTAEELAVVVRALGGGPEAIRKVAEHYGVKLDEDRDDDEDSE